MKLLPRLVMTLAALMLALSPALTPIAHAQNKRDIKPPTVTHKPDTRAAEAGKPLVITANVSDENGVAKVDLFYRASGTPEFTLINMSDSAQSGTFLGEIPAASVNKPGVEYYIQAEDLAGNTLLRGFAFEPLTIAVVDPTPVSALASRTESQNTTSSGLGSKKTLIWVGLGALLVGGLALAGGGGSDANGDGDDNVTIGAPLPQ